MIAITDVQQSQAGYDDAVAVEIESQKPLLNSHEQLREIVGEIVPELAPPTDDLPLLTPETANADEWVPVALDSNWRSSRAAWPPMSPRTKSLSRKAIACRNSVCRPTATTRRTGCRLYSFDHRRQPIPSNQLPVGESWTPNMTFPIYTGGRNRSRIQQSVYRHRAATEALERIARQTERQTRDAYLGVISEISRVRALRQSVESNRTALRATEAGFEVGTQTTVDVPASQNNLRRAETMYSRSRYDYMINALTPETGAGQLSKTSRRLARCRLPIAGRPPVSGAAR